MADSLNVPPKTGDARLDQFLESMKNLLGKRLLDTNSASYSPTVTDLEGGKVRLPSEAPPTYITPPAPTNVQVAGGIGLLSLTWDDPRYKGHAYAEVFRSVEDVVGSAVRVGSAIGSSYVDAVSVTDPFFYWVRFVNVNGVTGPFNAVLGTAGAAKPDPKYLKAILDKAVGESELTVALGTSLKNQGLSITALNKQYTVKIDDNGYVTGYGLASTLVNSTPYSEFTVRADRFAIASPAVTGLGLISPFIVLTTPLVVNGVTCPPGVYMDGAFIKNGTIGEAQIGTAVITDAKIVSITAAKIRADFLSAITSKLGRIVTGFITNDDGSCFIDMDVSGGAADAVLYFGNGRFQVDGKGNLRADNAYLRGDIVAKQVITPNATIDEAGNLVAHDAHLNNIVGLDAVLNRATLNDALIYGELIASKMRTSDSASKVDFTGNDVVFQVAGVPRVWKNGRTQWVRQKATKTWGLNQQLYLDDYNSGNENTPPSGGVSTEHTFILDTRLTFNELLTDGADAYGSTFGLSVTGWETINIGPGNMDVPGVKLLFSISEIQQVPVTSTQNWGNVTLQFKVTANVVGTPSCRNVKLTSLTANIYCNS